MSKMQTGMMPGMGGMQGGLGGQGPDYGKMILAEKGKDD